MSETTLQIIPAEDVKALVETLPVVLEANNKSVAKAEEVGQALLDTIEGEGMNDDLDVTVNNYLVKADTTLNNNKAKRTSVTKLFDQVKSVFTSLEARLDKKKEGSIPFKLQAARDAYATKKAKEEQERQRKIQEDKDRSLERIALKENAVLQLRNGFSAYIKTILDKLNADIERVTLDKYDAALTYFTNFNTVYSRAHLDSIKISLMRKLVAEQDINEITDAAKAEVFDAYAREFTEVIAARKQEILDLLPGKKKQLEEAAAEAKRQQEAAEQARKDAEALSAKQKKEALERAEKYEAAILDAGFSYNEMELRFEKGQYSIYKSQLMVIPSMESLNVTIDDINEKIAADEKRIADQQAKEKADQEARDKKAADDAALKAQMEQTNTLFDATVSAVPVEETAKTRESLEIVVSGPQGWMAITAQWFQIEGSKMALDKFEKKTFGSMKTACEKHAHKGGDRITHPQIEYKEVFKAVTVKS